MKIVTGTVALTGIAGVLASSCGGPMREPAPAVAVAPSENVLRDVRKDAARKLGCQAPNVSIVVESWEGSHGTVIAAGCGFQIVYYVACQTSAFCKFSATG